MGSKNVKSKFHCRCFSILLDI